jgi:hypothetical protein
VLVAQILTAIIHIAVSTRAAGVLFDGITEILAKMVNATLAFGTCGIIAAAVYTQTTSKVAELAEGTISILSAGQIFAQSCFRIAGLCLGAGTNNIGKTAILAAVVDGIAKSVEAIATVFVGLTRNTAGVSTAIGGTTEGRTTDGCTFAWC